MIFYKYNSRFSIFLHIMQAGILKVQAGPKQATMIGNGLSGLKPRPENRRREFESLKITEILFLICVKGKIFNPVYVRPVFPKFQ